MCLIEVKYGCQISKSFILSITCAHHASLMFNLWNFFLFFLPLNLSSSPLYVGPTHTFCEQFFLQAHAFLPAIRVINRFMSHRQQNERNTACTKKYVESSYEQSANDAFIHPRISFPTLQTHTFIDSFKRIFSHTLCVFVFIAYSERERERYALPLYHPIPSERICDIALAKR